VNDATLFLNGVTVLVFTKSNLAKMNLETNIKF